MSLGAPAADVAAASAGRRGTLAGTGAGVAPVTRRGTAVAQPDGDRRLTLRRVVAIIRADLEECAVGETAVGVAPRRADQVGQDRRAHDLELGADRVDEAQLGRHAAEEFGLARRHERKGDRLDEPTRRERAAHEADATLHRRQGRPRQGRLACEGHRRDRIVAVNAQDLLDEVGLAFDIAPPGRRGDHGRAVALVDAEAERLEEAPLLGGRHVDAAERGDAVGAQRIAALPLRHGAGDNQLARLAAA